MMINYHVRSFYIWLLFGYSLVYKADKKMDRKRRKRTVRTGPVPFDLLSWVLTYGFGRGITKIRRNSYARGRITDELMPYN